jgi:hypothetical protein
LILAKVTRTHHGEGTVFSISGVGKPEIHMDKNERRPSLHTIHKNQLDVTCARVNITPNRLKI